MGWGRSQASPLEAMEARVLLSAYTLGTVGYIGGNDTGLNPQSTLVADAGGNLFGTAFGGGTYAAGTVFEIAKGSGTITPLASFNGANGQSPSGWVTLDASGNLFGTTEYGGASGYGTVFEIANGSNAITTLASFNRYNGAYPQGGVTLDAAGNLFGTASGGSNPYGSVFEIATGSNTITPLAYFGLYNGESPTGPLTLDAAGNLFGTTPNGGGNGTSQGTAFEIASGSTTITTLALFNGPGGIHPTGSYPAGRVTLDAAGNLYGTTSQGGSLGDGTVFEIARASNAITTLASFNGTNGSDPQAGVMLDASGNLYGTTQTGGANNQGTVFEVASGSSAVTTLVSFDGAHGAAPIGGLTQDAPGNLYGTTDLGGTNNAGTVFQIGAGSNAITTLAAFNASGKSTTNGVAFDAAGNLFGTTPRGGASDAGTVFEIKKGSSTITTLAAFDAANGQTPEGTLGVDAAGNLFGTTNIGGGVAGFGTVFEVASGTRAITTLATFNNSNGANPYAGVTLDAAGNLYGTTANGGAGEYGTVFEIARGTNAITVLASFDPSHGENPFGPVTLDAAGNLFGTTSVGGAYDGGTVFEIAKGSNTITTIASIGPRQQGNSPDMGVALDAAGNLYGATGIGSGANNDGAVFEVARGSNVVTTLVSFNGTNGQYPTAGVTLDAAGNLYGTTADGGASNIGTVYEIPRGSNTLTTLYSFTGTNGPHPNGAYPGSPLALDATGNLYGTTAQGAAGGQGTVFEFASNTAVMLTMTSGSNPAQPGQSLGFHVTVTGGVPDGEVVMLVDASNNNAVVATGTLAGGSAALSIPAGTLAPGTHKLVAAYGGDANFTASQSAAWAQMVLAPPPTLVGAPVVNGDNPNGLYTAAGQPAPGAQRSMVEDVVYIFNEPVTIPDANAAFTVQVAGSMGTVPATLIASAVPATSGTQWAVSLTGQPVGTLASIANGEYRITINPGAVFATDAVTPMAPGTGRSDTFYRLYGDINGDRIVNNADNLQFRNAQVTYNPAMDSNADGFVNNADNLQLRRDQAINFFSDGFVTTI